VVVVVVMFLRSIHKGIVEGGFYFVNCLLCIILSPAEEKVKQSKRIWKFIQGEAKGYNQPSLPQE
jgi:hypothetical protein